MRCTRLYLVHYLCLNLRPRLEKNEEMRTSIVVTHSIVNNIPASPESFSEASSESSFGGSPTLISRSLFTTSGKLGLFAAFWAAQSTSRSHKAGGVSSGMVAFVKQRVGCCCAPKKTIMNAHLQGKIKCISVTHLTGRGFLSCHQFIQDHAIWEYIRRFIVWILESHLWCHPMQEEDLNTMHN